MLKISKGKIDMAINFNKRSRNKEAEKEIDPCKIYEKLDRHANKGPLRIPVQKTVLNSWFNNFRHEKDVILKLPTGEGKTIVGLLMLQSKLIDKKSPCLYLCPNNYLVDQVKSQATEFGVPFCEIENNELPAEFINGDKILITNSHMLFNGRSTKFGIRNRSLHVATILLDDAHSCVEMIKSSCRLNIKRELDAYKELLQLFSEDLKAQGEGTFADIENKDYNAQLAIPYWAWQSKNSEVIQILSKYNKNTYPGIWFAWELLRDKLKNCLCVFSSKEIEISPYSLPIENFGSFFKATHRIFMSATISDNTPFIRDLDIDKAVIENPLTYDKKWSGEKMMLIPSLIDEELSREGIANWIGKLKNTPFGITVLTPSFWHSGIWKACGSTVINKLNLNQEINEFKNGKYKQPLVMASRYDGIDLPDAMCRVLIIDSLPINETITEKYQDECVPNSTYVRDPHLN